MAHDTSETDSSGTFEVNSISGGLFGCPKMQVIISKAGYESITQPVCCGDTVRLKPVAGQ